MSREMKDSGIEWIGKIPNGWEISRFKNVVNIYNGNSIKDSEKDNYTDFQDARPYISTKDIDKIYSTVDYENGLFVKIRDFNFRVAPKGSILMCIEGGSAGIKKAKIDRAVSFVNKLCCFNGCGIDNNYLYYFLQSPMYEDEFKKNIAGLIGGVNVEKLRNFKILVPLLKEQRKIADFLDKKCFEIDSLSEDIQKQIETLEEYKKSIITETVTKGLNPNVEMKDSGVKWIGKIPKDWELSKIGAVYDNRNIKVSDKEYAPLSITKKGVVPQLETAAKTNNGDNRKLVRKNDFVINSRSDRRGSCGISELDGSCSLINIVLKPRKNMCNKYYELVFKSDLFADEFYRWGHGIVDDLWSTKWSDMKNICIPMPSINEQQEIADYLDSKCNEIDSIIQVKKEQLNTLAEYKKSLIYEYVTGKKEVPECL